MKRFTKQIGITVLALALTVYLFVQIFLSVNVSYDIENVYMTSFESKKSFDIYIFRDEEPVYSDQAGGTSCYLAKDGEKVHKGQEIAKTYQSGSDATTQDDINAKEERLEIIRKSLTTSNYTSNDLGQMESSISSYMLGVIKSVNGKSISQTANSIENIIILLNSKQALLSSSVTLSSKEASLVEDISELKSTLAGKGTEIKAGTSGYFYSSADGFENTFTEQALEEMTLSSFEELKTKQPDPAILSRTVGKISTSSKWYIACAMTKRQSSDLVNGGKYEFSFPNSYGARISMQLERKIVQPDSDTVVMIFSSNTLKEDFDFSRKQTAEFVFDDYTGLKVPSEAVRYIDGRPGVYALEGNKVVFKEIKVITVQSGYCIVELPENYTTEEELISKERIEKAISEKLDIRDEKGNLFEEYRYHQKLDLYDAVIIGGKDIKEGMMLR